MNKASSLPGGELLPTETLPIITKPLSLTKKMERQQEAIMRKRQDKRIAKEALKTREVLISSRCPEKVWYRGQNYGKFEVVPLASQGWKNRRASPDHFTINRIEKNPAFGHVQEGQDFKQLGLQPELIKTLNDLKITIPTNIQVAGVPIVLTGLNTLLSAETGNGKTLAYLLPVLQQLLQQRDQSGDLFADRPGNSPLVLIVTPGRELAKQTKAVCDSIAAPFGLSTELLLGQEGTTFRQIRDKKVTHCDILVATFGILAKLVQGEVVRTSYLRHIILDEVDTLFDDSFKRMMTRFLRRIPLRCGEDPTTTGAQLLMVGATIPRSLDSVLEDVVDLESIERVTTKTIHRVLPHVTHRFFRLTSTQKFEKILDIAKQADKNERPTLIFCNTTETVDWLGLTCKKNGISCGHIGRKTSIERRDAMFEDFVSGKTNVLTCTDVISRGLDTKLVEHVINYDFPTFLSDYIHRCGRVGRVGSRCNTPLVTNFINKPYEAESVQKIEYSVRRMMALPNIDANIKGQYATRRDQLEEEGARKETRKTLWKQIRRAEKGGRTLKTVEEELEEGDRGR